MLLYAILFFRTREKKIKKNGLEFVQEIYDTVWNFMLTDVINNNLFPKPYQNKFPLFSDICEELTDCIEKLTVEDVERKLRFNYLFDSVLRVNFWLEYYKREDINVDEDKTRVNKSKFNYRNEINELNSFAKYLGYYVIL